MTKETIKAALESARTDLLRQRGTEKENKEVEISLSAVRAALGEITNAEIAKGRRALSEDEVIQVLRKTVKQREESRKIFLGVGAEEKALVEEIEARTISGYLPQLLSAEETEALVKSKIAELGLDNIRQIGQLMKSLDSPTIDKAVVSRVARGLLG